MGKSAIASPVEDVANIDVACSYIEGIVRGYRNGLLTSANYSNMVQCETIDGKHFLSPAAPLRHSYF